MGSTMFSSHMFDTVLILPPAISLPNTQAGT